MIQAVTTPTHRREFTRLLAGKPYFEATMGTACTLFGEHPASGWRFYLLPGTGALSLRGGTATLCGRLPAGPAGEEAEEELQGFLRFLRVDRLISEPAAPDGWQMTEPLLLWELPQGERLPLPPPPSQELYLETQPSMMPVSRLVFPHSTGEQEDFYSTACTALTHGMGVCYALMDEAKTPVCTVGSFARSTQEAYMSAGVTAPDWRGRGLAGWLIVRLANTLAVRHTVRFACVPALRTFYTRLGFHPCGELSQFIRKWEEI